MFIFGIEVMEGDGYKLLVDVLIFDVRERELWFVRKRKCFEYGKLYKLYSVLLNIYKCFFNYFYEFVL